LLLSELTSQMFCFKSHRDWRPYTFDSSKLCSVFKGLPVGWLSSQSTHLS